tara:strand:- start:379 stop:480 length:102 start_codon:yes stop_codon:yes gene_type:complete
MIFGAGRKKKCGDPIFGCKSKTVLGVHIGVYQP